jgi:hypothetical protein
MPETSSFTGLAILNSIVSPDQRRYQLTVGFGRGVPWSTANVVLTRGITPLIQSLVGKWARMPVYLPTFNRKPDLPSILAKTTNRGPGCDFRRHSIVLKGQFSWIFAGNPFICLRPGAPPCNQERLQEVNLEDTMVAKSVAKANQLIEILDDNRSQGCMYNKFGWTLCNLVWATQNISNRISHVVIRIYVLS